MNEREAAAVAWWNGLTASERLTALRKAGWELRGLYWTPSTDHVWALYATRDCNVSANFVMRLTDDGFVKVDKMPDDMESPFDASDYEDQPFDFGDGDIYADPTPPKAR